MGRPDRVVSHGAAAALWLAVVLPAAAGPPPSPWLAEDIGGPGVPGATNVDAAGVWNIQGGGDDIGDFGDTFQYAYQRVRGDGSITARLLARSAGNDWAKTGLMIRQDDTPGAPNLNYTMVGPGLYATFRSVPDERSPTLGMLGTTAHTQQKLYMHLQRVGQEIAGFYSLDGTLWTQAEFSPQPLATLNAEALFGLAVTSADDTSLATGRFDEVSVQPGLIAPYGLHASGGDRSVRLEWRPLPGVAGFNLYRGPASATAGQLVRLNASPVVGTSFTDTGAGLVNGTRVRYGIAPIVDGAGGQPAEGPLVTLPAAPAALPTGWLGCSLNEGPLFRPPDLDPATGEITVHGTGWDFWDVADQGYFVYQPLDGDGRVTVTALTLPSRVNDWAKAGLMLRESLDSGARCAALLLTAANGLTLQYRTAANENADWPGSAAVEAGDLKLPIMLRLTRQGRTITAEYRTAGGAFQSAGDPITFEDDLPRTVYVGLAITSSDRYQSSQAKFKELAVQKL